MRRVIDIQNYGNYIKKKGRNPLSYQRKHSLLTGGRASRGKNWGTGTGLGGGERYWFN